MANSKISALTELTSMATNDEFVIVDVSDTTQATSGTTKRIASSNVTSSLTAITTGAFIVSTDGTGDYNTDGVSDEVQINAAIISANTAGGGTVYLKSGLYHVQSTTINMLSDVELTGDPGVVITFVNDTSISCLEITNFSIHDLNLDSTAQTGGVGVFQYVIHPVNCTKARIYNNNIEAYAFGIFFTSDDAVGSGADSEKNWIENNYIRGRCNQDLIGGGAMDLTSVIHDLVIRNNHLVHDITLSGAGTYTNCIAFTPCRNIIIDGNVTEGRINMSLEKDPHDFSKFVNNTVRGAHGSTNSGRITIQDDYPTTHLNTSKQLLVANNTIQDGGILIKGKETDRINSVNIIGNVIRNVTGTTDSGSPILQHGINLISADHCNITGNIMDANGVTSTAGIYLSDSSNNFVSSNLIKGYTTGVDQAGTYTGNDFVLNEFDGCTTNAGSTITSASAIGDTTSLMGVNHLGGVGIGNANPKSALSVGQSPTNALITAMGNNGLSTSVSSGFNLGLEATASSGSGTGPGLAMYTNDGAALGSGDRLGLIIFGGSSSASAVRNSAIVAAYSSEAWTDASAYGSHITFETTLNTTTTRAEKARITNEGSIKVGGSANRGTTEGTNQLVLFDGTAPVGTLANGGSFYSASGEIRVMDAAGNSTLLSPHDHETNEWIFFSKNTVTGKVLRIDMERMMKAMNDQLGGGFIQEYIEGEK